MKYVLLAFGLFVLGASLAVGQEGKKGAAKKAEAAVISKELAALEKGLTDGQRAKLLELLNTGDAAALMALPEIGEARAAQIAMARPFKSPLDLMKVSGIGEGTVKAILKDARPKRKKNASAAAE